MAKELPKRSEVPVEHTWAVEDIYPDLTAWEKETKEVRELSGELAQRKGRLGESAEMLYNALKLYEGIRRRMNWGFSYTSLCSDVDSANTENQARVQSMLSLEVEYQSQIAFFEPEIIQIPEETLTAWYQELPDLEYFRNTIYNIRRLKEHVLSEEQEALLASAGEMGNTPEHIFSMFNNADIKFPEVEDADGERVRITHGRFIPLLESPNRRVRKETFEAFYHTYEQFQNTLAAAYSGQVKQLIFQAKARHYGSTLEAAVTQNNVLPAVCQNLIAAMHDNLSSLHRYVRLRKKCLGVDELHMYDIYTPIVADVAVEIPFEQAKETVLAALEPLGERYTSILKEGFANRWIDVYENEGKVSGAYSGGPYRVHPFVLLNYAGTLEEQFTLAHEMGHALHSYFSDENQSYLNSNYTMFVAEVASTVNEVLLMEYLLARTEDKKERAYLINHYLDSFKGTVFRQMMLSEFEIETNAMAERGESLTAEALKKVYYRLNEEYYGPDMVSDPKIAIEWARIPHFYYNFYMYQYASGFCAAVSIAKQILAEGEPAVKAYLEFLSSGCTDAPVELLKIAGVDMTTKAPIQSALDVFAGLVEELEGLMA